MSALVTHFPDNFENLDPLAQVMIKCQPSFWDVIKSASLKDSRALNRFSRLLLHIVVRLQHDICIKYYHLFGAGFVLLSLRSSWQATMPYMVVRAPVPRVVLTRPVPPFSRNSRNYHAPVTPSSVSYLGANLSESTMIVVGDLSITLHFVQKYVRIDRNPVLPHYRSSHRRSQRCNCWNFPISCVSSSRNIRSLLPLRFDLRGI